jgi:hypothetical protein
LSGLLAISASDWSPICFLSCRAAQFCPASQPMLSNVIFLEQDIAAQPPKTSGRLG